MSLCFSASLKCNIFDVDLQRYWKCEMPVSFHGDQVGHQSIRFKFTDFREEMRVHCMWPTMDEVITNRLLLMWFKESLKRESSFLQVWMMDLFLEPYLKLSLHKLCNGNLWKKTYSQSIKSYLHQKDPFDFICLLMHFFLFP